jgi:hypothetical protein
MPMIKRFEQGNSGLSLIDKEVQPEAEQLIK